MIPLAGGLCCHSRLARKGRLQRLCFLFSQLEAIDDETKDSLAQLDQEKEAIQMEYCKRTGCDMDDCYGGWTESEHQIMVKVWVISVLWI